MTYQFCAANPQILARLLRDRRPSLLVLDEVHHLREDGAWLGPFKAAWPYVDQVLCLSGTPFRSNDEPVPFIHTTGPDFKTLDLIPDDCVFEYLYPHAISDKPPAVARGVFERYDADVEWLEGPADDQVLRSAKLSEKNDEETTRKARRHSLNPASDWLDRVVRDSDVRLDLLRAQDPRAGGLVICKDTDHAVRIADLYVRRQQDPVAVYTEEYQTSNHKWGNGRKNDQTGLRYGHDPAADVLAAYRDGSTKWIVTVRKISEGVDIPRLRVLVYATTQATKLFFWQAFGRVDRLRRDLPKTVDQHAWVFIPESEPINGYAEDIEDANTEATLKEIDEDEDEPRTPRDPQDRQNWDEFISARPDYVGATFGGQHLGPELMRIARLLSGSPEVTLTSLRELESLGLLRLNVDLEPAAGTGTSSFSDPLRDLDEAKAKKDRAVKTWAGLRMRGGEFERFTDAAKACHREVGKEFGVWSENVDATVEQFRKATQWIGERIRELRGA